MNIRRTSASIAAGCAASVLAIATPAGGAENMWYICAGHSLCGIRVNATYKGELDQN
jgi:hypothetical protein